MIPRVFHQVWIGSKPVPDRLRAWSETWLRFNPGWEHVLWADHPAVHAGGPWTEVREFPPIINRWAYDHLPAYVGSRTAVAARSDIIRYEIVVRHGGVYLDFDVECFRPIGDLLEGVRLFIADEYGPANGNYMFGAAPNHPAMWDLVRDLGRNFGAEHAKVYANETRPARWRRWVMRGPRPWFWNVLALTGPQYLNRTLPRHPECVVFPWQLFNPLNAWHDPAKVTNWPDSCYGNHHFAGTWYDRNKSDPPAEFMLPNE